MPALSPVVQQTIATIVFVCVVYTGRQIYKYSSGITMNSYRDKSALYGRELKPGEPPSWP